MAEINTDIISNSSTGTNNSDEKNRPLLEIKDLRTYFFTEEGVVKAVDGISFNIFKDEAVGLVGETGCGKSVTALSIIGLVREPGKIVSGSIKLNGTDLVLLPEQEMRKHRGRDITMIFQDPLNSLNPVLKIGDQLAEVFLIHQKELLTESIVHGTNLSPTQISSKKLKKAALEESIKIITKVGIPDGREVINRYPHELSGGMRQRVMIAMALSCNPLILIADEPTTALDVTIEAQILELMKELKKQYKTSILLITHDLGIIADFCERVAVMYAGNVVEYADIKSLFSNPLHPYTRGLLNAIPNIQKRGEKLHIIRGTVPDLIYPPSGCRFHPRCEYRLVCCDKAVPRYLEIKEKYYVSCHLYDPEYKESPKFIWNEAELKRSKQV